MGGDNFSHKERKDRKGGSWFVIRGSWFVVGGPWFVIGGKWARAGMILATKNAKIAKGIIGGYANYPNLPSVFSFHQLGELPYRKDGVYNQ